MESQETRGKFRLRQALYSQVQCFTVIIFLVNHHINHIISILCKMCYFYASAASSHIILLKVSLNNIEEFLKCKRTAVRVRKIMKSFPNRTLDLFCAET